ncbi:MAG: putative negative regulator of RcsB-dependent stress response [Bermanella sp.]
MEPYRTDEEQIDALKGWWQENGKSTVLGILAALALFFGWQGWQTQQANRVAEASAMYQSLLEADTAAESGAAQLATAKHLAETLKSQFPSMTYAVFAAMYKAKYAARDDDWQTAESELQWVISQKPDAPILLQAKVRLAHVLLAQKRYEDAQKTLEGSDLGSYAALIAETRGDILFAQGKSDEALAAYQQAQAQLAKLENASQNPILDMKIRDLTPASSGADSE